MVSVTFFSVSLGSVARTPSTPKSRGNTSFTRSTVMFIPVSSEAYAATFFTAQFCTGGRYINIVKIRKISIGVRMMIPIHFNIFFMAAMLLIS